MHFTLIYGAGVISLRFRTSIFYDAIIDAVNCMTEQRRNHIAVHLNFTFAAICGVKTGREIEMNHKCIRHTASAVHHQLLAPSSSIVSGHTAA